MGATKSIPTASAVHHVRQTVQNGAAKFQLTSAAPIVAYAAA